MADDEDDYDDDDLAADIAGEGDDNTSPVPAPNVPLSDAALIANTQSPQKVMSDGVLAEQHSLTDQIAADRYINAKAATRQPGKGWRSIISFLRPPGSV